MVVGPARGRREAGVAGDRKGNGNIESRRAGNECRSGGKESESGNPDRFFACGMKGKRRLLWGLESRARKGRLANRPDGAGSPEQSFVFILFWVGCLRFECVRERLVQGLYAEKSGPFNSYAKKFNRLSLLQTPIETCPRMLHRQRFYKLAIEFPPHT